MRFMKANNQIHELAKGVKMFTKRLFPIAGVVIGLFLTACSAVATPVPPVNNIETVPTNTPLPPAAPADTQAVAPAGATVDITIQGFAFSPAEITMAAGTLVRWTNQDSATHTVKAADGSWVSPDIAKGATFEKVFDKAGTYDYICGIHPSMKGRIVVT
jgi:plastocyanin